MRYAMTAAVLVLLLAAGCTPGSSSTTGSTGSATVEATTEATTEATVEATTEATTEATSEATTEATGEATAEATTEATTEAAGTMTDTTGITGTMTDTSMMTDTSTMTGTATGAGAAAMAGATAHAELMTADGTVVGMAHFTSTEDGGVTIQVDVAGAAGAAAGDHGIHVHMVGACDPPDFMSAGEHLNPTNMKHGLQNPDGPHAGDLPNMTLDAQGSGTFNTTSALFTLGEGANSLMDADGSALVIHANPDDEVTDPSGNSGDRIVCGVIMADAMAQ